MRGSKLQIKNLKKTRKILFMGVIVIVVTFTMTSFAVPAIFQWVLTKMIRLERGNFFWNEWIDIQSDIFFKVYIFNITNHEEVLNGEIPTLHEIGPYVYQQKRTKEILHEDHKKGTVTYKPTIIHTFRPDLSTGMEDDPVTMLNIPLLTVDSEIKIMASMIRYLAKYYVESFDEQPFLHTTVGNILFKGIHSPMMGSISELMGEQLLPNNSFAFFNERNGTLDPIEVDTGILESSTFGNIKSWKGQPSISMWDGPSCNMINGTDATIFAPFIKKGTVLQAFEPELCRSIDAIFEDEMEIEGIPSYSFVPTEDLLSKDNPNNQCFCMESDKTKCPKSGLVSISACKHGAPIFLSFPHFLLADPSYTEPFARNTFKPNERDYKSFVIVEPNTGVLIKIRKQLQFNAHLQPSNTIGVLKKMPNLYVPLLWVDEVGKQSENVLRKVRTQLMVPLVLLEYGKWIFYSLGAICIIIGFGRLYVQFQIPDSSEILPEKERIVQFVL